MSKDWESKFQTWARGPSATEQQRAQNAETQIRAAISKSPALQSRNISVFTQGSYRNRVNVRSDSDVDIGVVCYDSFFSDYPDDNVKKRLSEEIEPATYAYATFKNELEAALVARFGRKEVTRGSKAFDIKANTYRVEADVAAFFEHRRYDTSANYISGVEMIPDSGNPARIRNWPEQHYQNAIAKNDATSRRYKRVVRVLKTLSNRMAEDGVASAKATPSFLIECLVFNADNSCFDSTSFYNMVRKVLADTFNNTIKTETCSEWGEVSELKYLFRASQPWTLADANKFLDDAWNYIGYK